MKYIGYCLLLFVLLVCIANTVATNGNMERLSMFVSNSGTIKHPNKYSKIYYVSTADLQAVIDGGVAIRISIAEVAGQVDADVAISQTTSTPDFQPNQEITMQSFTWWLSEGWVDIANDGSSVCVSQSSRSTRGQSCLAATALPLYLRVHCPATSSNDCQYSLKVEYACRKGWYIGPSKYCLPCNAGKYSNTEEASSCKNCQYDQYSVTGATSCDYSNTTCPPGTYSQLSNACVSCVAGKFQTQVGALSEAACVSCAPGKYSEKIKAISANDCTDCVQGKWASKTAADNRTVCQICSFGQYNLNPASTDCEFCPKGTYLADDKANEANHDSLADCLTCPSGYYSEERSRYCTRCPAGKETGTTTGSSSATDCTDCPVGRRGVKHYNDSLPSQCLDCQPGYYQNKTGMTICIPCMPGEANGKLAEGHSCETCSAGKYTNVIASTVCVDCDKGRYVSQANSAYCLTCEYGKYQDTVAATSCINCPKGRINSDVSMNNLMHDSLYEDCHNCSVGKYQPYEGRSVCFDCPHGAYSDTPGSFACALCKPGYASETFVASKNSTCKLCTSGYYASQFASNKCTECAAGKYGDDSVTGLRINEPQACVDCPTGYFMNHRAAKNKEACYVCPHGRWSNTVGSKTIANCQFCNVGKFSKTYGANSQRYCLNCTAGKYQNATGSSTCLACKAGKYGADNVANDKRIDEASSCINCPVGTYSNMVGVESKEKCSACPFGKVHSILGATSGELCTDCPLGFYSEVEGGSTCKRCKNGTTNNATGSEGCSPCLAGFYLNTDTQLAKCIACEPGTFSFAGASECKVCDAGKYTTLNDQTKCLACSKGKYNENQMQVGAGICKNCPASRFSTYEGSSSLNNCIFCSPGRYNNVTTGNTDLADCLECDVGKYTDAKGSFACKACPTLKTTFEKGSTSCRYCESGNILNGVVCQKCPNGTYATKGMPNCIDCIGGRYSSNTLDSCIACSEGTWSDEVKATSSVTCKKCPSGTYSNAIAASTIEHCNKCPIGKASDVVGATALGVCLDCLIGLYSDTEGLDSCKVCGTNKTTFTNGSSECSFCPAGTEYVESMTSTTYTTNQNINSNIHTHSYTIQKIHRVCKQCRPGFISSGNTGKPCSQCVAGTYNNSMNTKCSLCSRGTWSTTTGAFAESTCVKCEAGRYGVKDGENKKFLSTNDDGCVRCPVGKFSNIIGATSIDHCEDCAAGYYTDTLGTTVCKRCEPGKFSLDGASSCIRCFAGSYNNSLNTKCVLCDQGKWSSTLGANDKSACIDCVAGKFSQMYGRTTECTNCSIGRFNGNSGSKQFQDCEVCTEKTYQNEEGSTSCKQCPSPLTNTKKESATCSPCTSGKAYNPTTKECDACPSNMYSLDGDTNCKLCMKGTYRNSDGTGCKLCNAGFYLEQNGAQNISQCLPCHKGRFSSAIGLSDGINGCQKCPYGTASNTLNATSPSTCLPCPLNYYAGNQGQVQCDICDSGKATRAVGSISCERCRPGEFMHNQAGSAICKKCGPGKYSYGATAQCNDCPIGRYNNSDNTGCLPCAAGKWSDKISAMNESVCADCDAGTYNQVIGAGSSSNCLQCPKGRASNTVGATSLSSCIKCPINSFTNKNGATSCSTCVSLGAGMMNEEIGSAVCHGCPSGLYLNQTSRTCDLCAAGTVSVYGSTQCKPCEAGKYSNFNRTMCIDCEKGKWSDSISASSSSTCQNCPAGTYNNGIGGKDQSHCNKCPSGKSSNKVAATSLSHCIDCQQQYYTDKDGMTTCTKCPTLKTTFKNGSSECFFCAEGKYLTGKTCTQCVPGKWTDGTFSVCKSCAKGTYNNTKNTACVACSPGRYSETFEADAASTCILCDRGKFGAATGADKKELCTDCPLGRAHNSTGKRNLLDCLNCAVGFYAPSDGMTTCLKCERLKQNKAVGSTSCDYCPAGEYIDENALPAPTCKKCNPGFYSYSGSDKCTMCEAGKYSDRQINCIACSPGYYSNATAAFNISTCMPCPKGKFNSMDGSASIESCTSCPAGRVLDIVAAVSLHQCIRCDIGKYTTTPGQIECRNCPPRQTNTAVGSSACEYCDGGKFLNGTVVCTDCENGRYSKKGDEVCSSCLPGFFSSAGQTECEACERGKSNNIFAASQCNECRKGTFQDIRGKTDCEDCPVDSYNSKEGVKFQEHCTRCAARKTTNGTTGRVNSTACICRKGYLLEYNKPGQCPSDTLESGCFSCPEGGKCTSVALSIEKLHSQCGYWRRNATSCKLYPCGDHAENDCNVTSRCVGGVFGGTQNGGHKEKDQCRQNHTGPLCGACMENHRLWDDGYCYGCVQPPANMFQYVLYAFLIIFLGIIAIQLEVSAFYFFGFTSTRHVAIKKRKQTCWEHFLDARERGEWVRIMMNYFQIVSYIDIVFEIRWPNNFAWVPRYMRMFSSFDVTSWIHTFNWCLKFLGSVRYHSFIVTSMLVFVIIVVQVLKHCCKGLKPKSSLQDALDRKHKHAKKKKQKKKKIKPELMDEEDRAARDIDEDDEEDDEDEELSCLELNMNYIKSHFGNIQKHYATFAKSSFYMFSLMHCGLVARSFQVYRCDVELEPYERYLNADYAVSCHDPYTEWGASAALATTMLFTIGLGIPLYLAFRLRAYDMYIRSIIVTNDDIAAASIPNIGNFGRKKASQITLRETLAEMEFELRLKMAEKSAKYYYLVSNIYSLYREGFYWWELVEIVRSAIMTGCLILLRPGSFLQHVLGTLLLLVHLALVTVVKPYRNVYDNNVQFILSAVLVVTLPATAAVHRAKDNNERDGMLNYIIFLNVVVFVFAFILRARQDMQLKEKDVTKKKIHPNQPPPPARDDRPGIKKHPLPPIPDGKKRRKRGQDSQAKNFDLNDNSDSEDESKSDTASMEEQKIDISPTPPKKIVLDPIRPSNKNSKRPPPSFRGLQRLNTMHRKKITRQMSALDKLDLDRDGELEREEVVDAYVKNGLSQEEAEAKVNELVAKYDIDGDGTISLKEALNTEIAGAMEEEEHDIEMKMKHREDTQRTEHINKTQERLKKRMQKRGRKKKKGDEPNPNKDKLAKGDLVEFRITESSNAKKAKISNYDTRTGTYEVSLKGGQIIKDLTREQITLLPPQQFDRSKSPKRDGRPLPTKTMRSSNQNAQRNEQIKEAYNDRMKKKSMTKNEEDTDGTSSSDDDF